jgi:CRP/FNR family cyclic AMP-dependent transcriptional regulator
VVRQSVCRYFVCRYLCRSVCLEVNKPTEHSPGTGAQGYADLCSARFAISCNIALDPLTMYFSVQLSFSDKCRVFVQGDRCDAVFYIQKGRIKLTVASKEGKEATICLLNSGDFFGEDCLAGRPLRMLSASTVTPCSLMRIENRSMLDVLHRESRFSDRFVAHLLARNIQYEENLVDLLFNSCEKRLARILLLLAQFGKEGQQEQIVPRMSQETFAEMVGTTRSRVSYFLNRFRQFGFIEYGGSKGLRVHSSLLNVVLHD